jgi:hypothetical protein
MGLSRRSREPPAEASARAVERPPVEIVQLARQHQASIIALSSTLIYHEQHARHANRKKKAAEAASFLGWYLTRARTESRVDDVEYNRHDQKVGVVTRNTLATPCSHRRDLPARRQVGRVALPLRAIPVFAIALEARNLTPGDPPA